MKKIDIPEDRFAEKTTSHLRKLAESSEAIRTMYFFDESTENIPAVTDRDLFQEKQLATTKGLVQKYPGRALVLLSYTCAANCRYCERQDRVGVGLDKEGRLTDFEIDRVVNSLAKSTDVYEVIMSGGDPLTHPIGLLRAAEKLAALDHIKMFRIHTRLPLQLPDKVDFDLLEKISNLPMTPYLSLHVDHPDEITPQVEETIKRLRQLGYILLCQTVFLKGVNDDLPTLSNLFRKLAILGVRPYYIYHCQPIPTTMRFVMDVEDEMEIMTKLREEITGIAFPTHIIELQHSVGKIPVPTNHWNVDMKIIRDFDNNEFDLTEKVEQVQSTGAAVK